MGAPGAGADAERLPRALHLGAGHGRGRGRRQRGATVSGTDPAAGWVDAKSNANRVATTANGHSSWYAPALKRGTQYRFRVRASYEHYVFHRRRPDRHSDWGYKTLVAGAGTAVGLFAFNAFESRGLSSVRFNLANPVSHEVTVDYRTSVPPTRAATPGLDYLAVWGSFTFEPGDTERWLHLAITDDDIEDSGEQFVITLSNPRPANRVQLGSSSPGHGYHVHPLATSMTITIYNHEAELSALAVETAPGEDGPWTALDFGLFSAGTLNYAVTVPHGTTHARLKPTALHERQRLRAGSGLEPASARERRRERRPRARASATTRSSWSRSSRASGRPTR